MAALIFATLDARAFELHGTADRRTITLIAVITILLLELSDALPKWSIGGPMATRPQE